ncbi:MAG TPA: cupin domain-containing protein [Candidatus Baltobacteraceae bacterium]|nr:cupin domain-containing protein [Candidatus Baltobacteraceae bacterium]
MTLQKVSLDEKFALFSETWSQKIVGELNDFYVKLARLEGEFVWHHHETEDELFLVLEGAISMHYLNDDGIERVERFGPGEFLIVPHGIEHKPVASPGTCVVLLEPKTTVNTGAEENERTAIPQWI